MNTESNLKSILPTIEKYIRWNRDLDFGEGYGDYGTNFFDYDDGIWNISFEFSLWLTRCDTTRGRVYDLKVEHCDEETEEETIFSDDELSAFRKDIEDIICDLA